MKGPLRRWRPPRRIGLGRALAKAGYGTRANTDAMVRAGRVSVNGRVVHDPAQPVEAEHDIELDGEPLLEVTSRYFAFHKPLRVVVHASDTGGRRFVHEFLPRDVPGLRPAGRLDAHTSGLVLVSNDTGWNDLAASSRMLEYEYYVRIVGEIGELELGLLTAGVHLHNLGFIRPRQVVSIGRDGGDTELSLVFTQSRNRQVRRLFRALRHEVRSLRRVRIGGIELGDLPPGQLRALSPREVGSIRAARRSPGGGRP